MEYFAGEYDVVVVGAGHAGCEAALACARMGMKTLVTAINLDSIAMMACNPSIGGPAKGNLVREIDALGGEMGVNIDHTMIQIRTLNTKKGPAVRAFRAQADKKRYSERMKEVLENQENLHVKQAEIVEILTENNKVTGVKTQLGAIYNCKAVVVATGVYLNGKVVIGDVSYEGGPNGLFPAKKLSECLKKLGFELRRFKTGTPARIDGKSVDLSKMVEQPGDETIKHFSFMTDDIEMEQKSCYLTYTNETTHKIIRDNIHRSPLYTGGIEGVGPRYCPSIETKIVNFPERESHQIFIEPEGLNTREMYVQGMSTSLPEDVQIDMLRSVKGLENCVMMRTGYAIDYDCINPQQLKLSLEAKHIDGLFFAGQINGSSGYEEAAAQGLIAGINAALKLKGKEPLILDRSEAYIGVLIDDLVTKGTNEPYRMMTSRAEYRLILRQDNADLRLTQKGYDIGLVTEERYQRFIKKKQNIENELERLKKKTIGASDKVKEFLNKYKSADIKSGISLYDLLKRPEIKYQYLAEIDDEMPGLTEEEAEELEIQIKYEGYIKKQLAQVEQFKKLEGKKIPEDIDYKEIKGLSSEARQKLTEIRPVNIGQASRISGVSPADISVLMVYMEQLKRR
ncbi:MAG TPA: tRNA uridine-5-carboxymethylaminomethyl(34) synthesis enzyme MnmG [Clostridiales bacterium]|nr:tRNA uridine-5-carboxymethylaminomethyl(34) synthesis enzyme MnmG [Clostridiales bacterium]